MTNEWQPIETAPKDRVICLYGLLDPHPDDRCLYGDLETPCRALGYWCDIDESWTITGSTWTGPWFKPSKWCEAPPMPEGKA